VLVLVFVCASKELFVIWWLVTSPDQRFQTHSIRSVNWQSTDNDLQRLTSDICQMMWLYQRRCAAFWDTETCSVLTGWTQYSAGSDNLVDVGPSMTSSLINTRLPVTASPYVTRHRPICASDRSLVCVDEDACRRICTEDLRCWWIALRCRSLSRRYQYALTMLFAQLHVCSVR